MKVLLTGGTGFVGLPLLQKLLLAKHDVVVLTRDAKSAKQKCDLPVAFYDWQPETQLVPSQALENIDAVIHLAGESVGEGRWTKSKKEKIERSRTLGTQNLMKSLLLLQRKPAVVISASAIGYYGDRGEEVLTETSSLGKGFLPDVCAKWEDEVTRHQAHFDRTVILRIGIVLEKQGGALNKMLPLFKLGVAGPIASGRQWMSWIHRLDLIDLILFSLHQKSVHGVVNAVAPQPVTNKEFTKTLAGVLKRPALFPAPAFALKIAMGETSDLVLNSQHVSAGRALELGFVFSFNRLDEALRDILQADLRKEYFLEVHQWLPYSRDKVFPFFSNAYNLEKITPPWLKFKVLSMSTPEIQQGTLIDYKLTIRGVPLKWRTRIEEWQPVEKFVDTQLKGPYSLWHHTHTFQALHDGTLISDSIRYKVPFGFLGRIFAGWYVKRDVQKIFNYRKKQISEIYNQLEG